MADDAVFTGRAIDFLQDFQGTAAIAGQLTRELPAGFTVENVDGRTPAANVDYVNKAWIVREDFAFDTADFVAMSTSWYAPVGQSNDWIFTNKLAVSQGCTLAWNAIAYDNAYQDGYEVRFCTTPTAAGCVGETPLFTIAAEQSTWTARTADMSGITDTTGYLAFRNNTNDKFLLVVDDITVTCP